MVLPFRSETWVIPRSARATRYMNSDFAMLLIVLIFAPFKDI